MLGFSNLLTLVQCTDLIQFICNFYLLRNVQINNLIKFNKYFLLFPLCPPSTVEDLPTGPVYNCHSNEIELNLKAW